MKFTLELSIGKHAEDATLSGNRIAGLAQLTEQAGFDAVGFNDHPAPSRAWLDVGGHEAFDPFAAMAFCAGVTQHLHVMSFLAVVPYRNPHILAKSLATVDAFSHGRVIACLGTGYLRSEFKALGVDFDQRNQLFDEAVAVLNLSWAQDGDLEAQPRPRPVQPPIPLWIGGNSKRSRERAVEYGAGWSPMMAQGAMAETTRTPALSRGPELSANIADLHELARAAGRNPADFAVQINGGGGQPDIYGTAEHLEELERLGEIGVTQIAVQVLVDDSSTAEETVELFGTKVVPFVGDEKTATTGQTSEGVSK